jgi:hypothetical protein
MDSSDDIAQRIKVSGIRNGMGLMQGTVLSMNKVIKFNK